MTGPSGQAPLSPEAAATVAQVTMLWMVVRALAASHPDLPAVLAELRQLAAHEDAHDVYSPLPDRALDGARQQLQEFVAQLEALNKNRETP